MRYGISVCGTRESMLIRNILESCKGFIEWVGKTIEAAFEQHKLVRRALVIWALWLITVVVLKATEHITTIDTPTAAMISTIVGILATVTAFYIKSRQLDDKHDVD
jgi:hypothetical protein